MTQEVMVMMALLSEVKKLSSGCPLVPIRPNAMPRTMENTTRPKMLVVSSKAEDIGQSYKFAGKNHDFQ